MSLFKHQDVPEITIRRLKFSEIAEVKGLYESSSDSLKKNAWSLALNFRIGMIHLVLSVTPLRYFLLFEIKPLVAKKGEIFLDWLYN